MWQSLSSSDFVAFYADFEGSGDLSPIRRVVGALAARHYSSILSAYTAMGLFTITFDRDFEKSEGAGTVTLSLDSKSQLFGVYYQGPVKQDVARFVCEEFEVCRLVDALVVRMHLTRNGTA